MGLSTAHAHPVAQGSLEVRVLPDALTARFRVSNEQIFVAESIGPNARPANSLDELWERHANYMRYHVVVTKDGVVIPGKLLGLTPPADQSVKGFTEYVFEFPVKDGSRVELRQSLLQEIEYAPGNPWEATFIARIVRDETVLREAAIFSAKQPLVVDLNSVASAFESTASPGLAPLTWDYFVYGLHHIAAGWDHILFVVALVLAVPRVWPVLALVTVFTIAHTITLSLAVLRIVSAPSAIVEPVIAISIVVAAALNLVRSNNPPLAPRLVVAFGFGLFHGLGFASGLIAAMEGFRASALAAAIAGFSVGVEAGHQLVVVPLVLLLWVLQRYADGALPRVTRVATIAVLVAGLWLLSYSIRREFAGIGWLSESEKFSEASHPEP
jgi:hydrogenase/urease accessory protein HupE